MQQQQQQASTCQPDSSAAAAATVVSEAGVHPANTAAAAAAAAAADRAAAFTLLLSALKALAAAMPPLQDESRQSNGSSVDAALPDPVPQSMQQVFSRGVELACITLHGICRVGTTAGSFGSSSSSSSSGASSNISSGIGAAAGELQVLLVLLVAHSLQLVGRYIESAIAAAQQAGTGWKVEKLLMECVITVTSGVRVSTLECIAVGLQWLHDALQQMSTPASQAAPAAAAESKAEAAAAESKAAAAAAAAESNPAAAAAVTAESKAAGSVTGSDGSAAAATQAATVASGLVLQLPPQLLQWLQQQCRYLSESQGSVCWKDYRKFL
jgi:hypothetical protein